MPTPEEIERRIAELSRLVEAGLPTDAPAPDPATKPAAAFRRPAHAKRMRTPQELEQAADPAHRVKEAERKRMFRLALRLARKREADHAALRLLATYLVAVLLPDGRICHVRGRTRSELRLAARDALGITAARLPKGTRFFIVGGPG